MTFVNNRAMISDLRKKLRQNMTKAEVKFWLAVKGRKVGGIKFRRQHSLDWYIVDFYAAQLKLAVEIDGDIHDTPEAIAKDQQRSQHLVSLGVRVIRFTNDDVLDNLPGVLDRLRGHFPS